MILLDLALFFSLLSLLSVGGMPSVIPEMHRYVVEQKAWISHGDFIEMFALGQAAPGPNVLISSLIGWKIAGVPGAFVTLAALYADFAGEPTVKRIVVGVAAAGAGLFIGTAIKLAKPIARKPAALVVVAGCFIAVGVGRVSMLLVIPVAAAISYYLSKRGLL